MLTKSLQTLFFGLLLAFAGLTPVAAEDLTIVSTVTPSKGAPTTSTQYMTAERILTSDGRYDTVMDLANGTMIQVDHKKKQYFETSLAEMRAQLAELERMLESNPMLGKMFGDATEVTVEKGTGSRRIAGHDTQQYFLTIGPKFRFELWVAPGLEPPVEYYDARKFLYAAMGPIASRFEKMYDAMKELDGFPLMTKVDAKIMGFNADSVSEATEVRKGSIDPSVFEPPAGYKKKKSPYRQKG